MIRRVGWPFRASAGNPPSLTCLDFLAAQPGGWTLGATLIDAIPAQLIPLQKWKLVGFAISGNLVLFQAAQVGGGQTPTPFYGKFGTILGGISQQTNPTQPGTAAAALTGGYYTQPMQPLPTDLGDTIELWNPASDPLPPVLPSFSGSGPAALAAQLPFEASTVLQQPIDVMAGMSTLIGIWMKPSLLSFGISQFGGTSQMPCLVPTITTAQYQILYDDLRK